MRAFLSFLFAVSLLTQLVAAPVPKNPEKNTAQRLQGKWKLVKPVSSLPEGTSFIVEFTGDGKLILRYEATEKSLSRNYEGTFKAEGTKLEYKVDSGTGERTEVLTILKLTEEDLTVTDPDKKQEDFRRVPEKK